MREGVTMGGPGGTGDGRGAAVVHFLGEGRRSVPGFGGAEALFVGAVLAELLGEISEDKVKKERRKREKRSVRL